MIKSIKIDVDKCNGCRACEVICSAFHSSPRYSGANPARSRIRVLRDPLADIYVPVYAGEYTAAECSGRDRYTIDGKAYQECAFCRASCPSRDWFKEPDSGLPLKCDMCESDPTLAQPMCVEWCLAHALTYEVREAIAEEAEHAAAGEAAGQRSAEGAADLEVELEVGLQALAEKHGWHRVVDLVARMTSKGSRGLAV